MNIPQENQGLDTVAKVGKDEKTQIQNVEQREPTREVESADDGLTTKPREGPAPQPDQYQSNIAGISYKEKNHYWIPNFDINKKVITQEIQYYLGPESTVRPYKHEVLT